jgi:dipeptidyl aminopeptidase/acylaminoacyl peptidase
VPGVKPTDLTFVNLPGKPALTPDGRYGVVARRHIDLAADDYTSQLWLVPVTGDGGPRQLTHGWRDDAPAVSPDGYWLAFVRATHQHSGSRAGGEKGDFDGPAQLCVMPLTGGEPRRLTDHPFGAGPPAWSPDSTRLAYATRVPEEGRYGTGADAFGEKLSPEAEPPRRITSLWYRLDDLGFTMDRPKHVFVTDLDGDTDQVTTGAFDHGDPTWSPDGQWLTFAAARHETHGEDLAVDLWLSRPDGTDLRRLTDTTWDLDQPKFTPDGSAVVAIGASAGPDRLDDVIRSKVLHLVPVADGHPQPILDQARFHVAAPGGDFAVTESGVLFPNEDRGAVQLIRVPYDGSEPTVLLDGKRQVDAFSVAADTIVATVGSPDSWGALVALENGVERLLVDWSDEYRADFPVYEQTELNATAPDGYPVHGWVVRPTGPGPFPVLLMIHGGPYAQYGWRLFDEAQVLANAGYAVVMGNPRGSSGYGEAHGRAIVGNVGAVTTVDVLALLDAALEAPDLDSQRVGVLGGSHGGFMTTWLAAHHGERFKAAISERAVNAIDSFAGSSDIGWFFVDAVYGTTDVAAQSPLTYADKINVPMLLIHSEHDWRCPIEQAQRLFVALKRGGKPVEMLVFPGEGHELSRTGRPSHRVARFDAILEWFGRHL